MRLLDSGSEQCVCISRGLQYNKFMYVDIMHVHVHVNVLLKHATWLCPVTAPFLEKQNALLFVVMIENC